MKGRDIEKKKLGLYEEKEKSIKKDHEDPNEEKNEDEANEEKNEIKEEKELEEKKVEDEKEEKKIEDKKEEKKFEEKEVEDKKKEKKLEEKEGEDEKEDKKKFQYVKQIKLIASNQIAKENKYDISESSSKKEKDQTIHSYDSIYGEYEENFQLDSTKSPPFSVSFNEDNEGKINNFYNIFLI